MRRLGVLLAWAMPAAAAAAGPSWVCTTADVPWAAGSSPTPVTDPNVVPDVEVHPEAAGQEIDGFGGCFNELGWDALAALPPAARDGALRALFGDDGCRFNLARAPIGASDYGRDWYSLEYTPGDLPLAHFSIDRDRRCLIPYIKAAMAVRPSLRVWASPWSPPAWMKDSGQYNGGHLKQDPATLDAYATYLARYAEAYCSAGVDLYAVHVQNEPIEATSYPSCQWTGAQERDFIRDHLGPTFRDRKLPVQIWLGTINEANFNAYPGVVLADPAAAAFVAGVAFQWGGRQAIGDAHRLYPRLRLIQSENECGGNANSFADAEHTFDLLRSYLGNGADAYFYWNMVLPPGGRSSWGWPQNAMVTADAATGRAVYHPEFYLMKHVAHFVPPGSHLVAASGAWGDKLAFVRPDGSAVLVMGNSTAEPVPVVVGTPRSLVRATLPGHSFATFVFPGR